MIDEKTNALGEWKLIGIERSQLARFSELHQPTVNAHADDEIVAMIQYLLGGGDLRRAAETVGRRPGAVDLAQEASAECAGRRDGLARRRDQILTRCH